MQSRLWNYIQRGQSLGPVPEEQLRGMLASGELFWDDMVWREGLTEWTPARLIPDLVTAPPPPPAPPKPPATALALLTPVPIQLAPHPELEKPETLPGATPLALEWLRQTKPWVRFLAVLGFIGTLLPAGAIVWVGLTADLLPRMPILLTRALPLAGAILLLAILLPLVLRLNGYANRIGRLLRSKSPQDLDAALCAQKGFWKHLGILTLILLLLQAVALGTVLALGWGSGRLGF